MKHSQTMRNVAPPLRRRKSVNEWACAWGVYTGVVFVALLFFTGG